MLLLVVYGLIVIWFVGVCLVSILGVLVGVFEWVLCFAYLVFVVAFGWVCCFGPVFRLWLRV